MFCEPEMKKRRKNFMKRTEIAVQRNARESEGGKCVLAKRSIVFLSRCVCMYKFSRSVKWNSIYLSIFIYHLIYLFKLIYLEKNELEMFSENTS